MRIIFTSIIVFFLFTNHSAQDYGFSLTLNYNYITTSKLFLQPNSPDEFLRGIHQDFDDIKSYSAEIRYKISESIFIGLASEIIEKTVINPSFNLAGSHAEVREGYKVIPFELSIYYQMPFSTKKFKFFMGGGGLYIGKHIRQIAAVSFNDAGSKYGFGIHVAFGMDYFINNYLSLRGQMRFRDPELELNSKYSESIVDYNGRTFLLSTRTFNSKVNVDGVTFSIGLAINF